MIRSELLDVMISCARWRMESFIPANIPNESHKHLQKQLQRIYPGSSCARWRINSANIPDKLLNFIRAVGLNGSITVKWKNLQEKLQRISPVRDHILSKKQCALVLISLEYNSPLYLLFVPSTICMGMQCTEYFWMGSKAESSLFVY